MCYITASRKKASILIITLWTLCLLTIFAVHLGYNIRQKIIFIKRLDQISGLRYIAEAGAREASALLDSDEEKSYFALNEAWSNNPGLFKDVEVGSAIFNVCYRDFDPQSGLDKLRYGLIDEERKININKADLNIMTRFFTSFLNLDELEAQGLAASIVDWRDQDNMFSVPQGGAEDSYYRNLQYPYEAKDSDFKMIDELLLVRGFSQDIFERTKDYLTVYGNGRININTATAPVLLALGLSQRLVDCIVAFRKGQDETSGTLDDNIFYSSLDIVPHLSQAFRLSSSEVALLSNITSELLTTKSENFTIRSIANSRNRKNRLELICVVNLEGKILYWQET